MKRVSYLLLMLLLLAFITAAGGCGKKETATAKAPVSSSSRAATSVAPDSAQGDHVIKTPDEFLASYRDFADRLDSLAERTRKAYLPWSEGKVPVEKYLDETRSLYEEMKALNSETDLKTEVELKAADQKAVRADAVMRAYLKASKDVNDFLVVSNTRPDNEIKAKYQELMVNKYPRDMQELKKLLAK